MSNTPVSRSERIIDQVLAEAGLEDADELRPVLLELRAIMGDQPQPSPQILALMSGDRSAVAGRTVGAPARHMASVPASRAASASNAASAGNAGAGDPDSTVVDLAARRRNKHRLPLTALGVAVALAAGAGAAAATDQGVRQTLNNAFSSIAATFGDGQGRQRTDQDVPASGHPDGKSQGTVPAPAHTQPSTPPSNSASADGQTGQDKQSHAPGQSVAGSGQASRNPLLGKNTPSVPGTGHQGPGGLPVPEVTAPEQPVPSVPAVPAPQR